MMFGVAYVVSSTPRSMSKRSIALIRPMRADLHEVLELLAAVRVAPRERAHERQVQLDQLLARLHVAVVVVAAQQLAVGPRPPAPSHRLSRLGARQRHALLEAKPVAARRASSSRHLLDEGGEQSGERDLASSCLTLEIGPEPFGVERADHHDDRVAARPRVDGDLLAVDVPLRARARFRARAGGLRAARRRDRAAPPARRPRAARPRGTASRAGSRA